MGVMANHAPLISTLKTGIIEVHNGGAADKLLVRGGFAEVNPKGLTVLAEEAYPLAELDRDKLTAELRDAEEDVADAKDEVTRQRAEKARDRLAAIVEVLNSQAA